MYGLFKCATVGSCNANKPWVSLADRAKWDAWKKLDGTDQDAAKKLYVEALDVKVGDSWRKPTGTTSEDNGPESPSPIKPMQPLDTPASNSNDDIEWWKVTPHRLVGKKIEVRWAKGRSYSGKISDYNQTLNRHLVEYDDGERKWYDLAGKSFWLRDSRSEFHLAEPSPSQTALVPPPVQKPSTALVTSGGDSDCSGNACMWCCSVSAVVKYKDQLVELLQQQFGLGKKQIIGAAALLVVLTVLMLVSMSPLVQQQQYAAVIPRDVRSGMVLNVGLDDLRQQVQQLFLIPIDNIRRKADESYHQVSVVAVHMCTVFNGTRVCGHIDADCVVFVSA